jgi:hypothetical protein
MNQMQGLYRAAASCITPNTPRQPARRSAGGAKIGNEADSSANISVCRFISSIIRLASDLPQACGTGGRILIDVIFS